MYLKGIMIKRSNHLFNYPYSGDLVSNMNLSPYLEKHKQILAKDKKAIMTSVYSKVINENFAYLLDQR